jgi:hypothetical protein
VVGQEGDDVPSLTLMGRALDARKSPPENFDGVFDLLQK